MIPYGYTHLKVKKVKPLHYPNVAIYFQDCVEGMKERIKTASVQSIITDPPFGIGFSGKSGSYSRIDEKVVEGYVEVPFEEYEEFSYKWLSQAYRVLKQSGTCYVFCPQEHVHHVIQAAERVGFIYKAQLIYVREFPLWRSKGWVISHYNLLLFTKSDDYKFNMIEDYQKNILYEHREQQEGNGFAPTRLCFKTVSKLIRASTDKRDLIVEPFAGSGTVIHAAWLLNRLCVGFELNVNMRDIISSSFTSSDLMSLMVVDNKCPVCGAPIIPYDRRMKDEFHEVVKFKCTECVWRE
jgi:site-specific DNA-methyltransferase (adenine-specific)